MREIALIVLGLIGVLSNIPYIRDVLAGRSKPNLASWSTWTLLNIIIVISTIAADATNTLALGAAYLIGSSTVLTLALFKGTRKYTLFDAVCQAIALIGVVIWQLSDNPNFAMLFVLIIDISAIIPTFRHGYQHPFEETWLTYLFSGLTAFAFAALATTPNFSSLAITVESGIINCLLVWVIIYRRAALSKQELAS